jgi:hypothetical protein
MWASLNVEVDEGIVHLFGKYGGRRSRERTARRSRNSRKPLDKRAALRVARSGGSRFAPRRATRGTPAQYAVVRRFDDRPNQSAGDCPRVVRIRPTAGIHAIEIVGAYFGRCQIRYCRFAVLRPRILRNHAFRVRRVSCRDPPNRRGTVMFRSGNAFVHISIGMFRAAVLFKFASAKYLSALENIDMNRSARNRLREPRYFRQILNIHDFTIYKQCDLCLSDRVSHNSPGLECRWIETM